MVQGLPVPDWKAVTGWVVAHPAGKAQANAWIAGERAWLDHLRVALGTDYHLAERRDALLLSTLAPHIAGATLDFMNKTQQRILRVLDGVAQVAEWGRDILIVFDNEDRYYEYVSRYYPDAGGFAFSGGMHINDGCSHFVTMKADLLAIQPVIAHEMTHGLVAHLPLPAWLNEGIAVNTEQRLCGRPQSLFTPYQMHEKHLRFWGDEEIQQFWSGKSFLRDDEGNLLSYDLARIIVEQFSKDWDTFRRFVLAAHVADAGSAAAREVLGVDLGDVVSALLERDAIAEADSEANSEVDSEVAPDADAESDARLIVTWSPDPALWNEAPERGAF